MSKSAAYKAIGQGLMFGAQQWQQKRAETAAARREQALEHLRYQYNTAEQTREHQLNKDLADFKFQREQEAAEREYSRGEPKRDAELESERALAEQRRASAEASRARASAYGEEGGGQNLTANQRDALALAKAKGIPEGQAWDYVMQSGRQPPERIVVGIASDLMSANEWVYEENPEQAYEDARKIYDGLRDQYQFQGSGGLMSQGRPSPEQQGSSGPNVDPASEVEMATQAVQSGRDPAAIAETMRRRGVPDHVVSEWLNQNGR